MSVVHESFFVWRIKFLIPAVVILLMLISVLRRHILPFVFGMLFLLVFVSPVRAASWNDVIVSWAAQPVQSGCINFVSKYTQNGQTGYQLWKRCGGSIALGYYKQYYNGSSTSGTNMVSHSCTGTGTTVWTTGGWLIGSRWQEQHFCDGSAVTTAPETYVPPSGIKKIVTQPCLEATYGNGSTCASADVLIQDFFPVDNECPFSPTLQVQTPGGWTGTEYTSLYQDNGKENVCNQCIPAGTIPSDNPAHNTLKADDLQGRYQCYWVDVTGDPGKLTDSFVPNSVNGGSQGNSGQTRPQQESNIYQSATSDGSNTEITTTETITNLNADGSTTKTKTTSLSYCVDLNADGISDLSGRKCDETTTETSTTSSFTLNQKAGYTNADLPTVGNFGSLFTSFAATVRATQLFSTFSLSGLAPVGAGSSSYTLDFGNYGTHNFNLANYSTALNIIKGFMLLLASYLAVRVVVLKR